MGRDLMTLDCFRESIMRSDALLRPYGVHLSDLLMDSKDDTFNNTINSFVGIAAIQVSIMLQTKSNRFRILLFKNVCQKTYQ